MFVCQYMRSSCIEHLCDKLVQLCMLSGKAYHGSVSELKGASSLQVTGSILPARPKTSGGEGTEELRWGQHTGRLRVRGRTEGHLQLGEMVRLRRQLHVKHLRMLMVMCMRGPKLKSRL